MQIFFYITEDHHDGLFALPTSEICVESDIRPGTKAEAERSGYIRSLTRSMCRRYQVPGDKY
jgi:hypothetical protein